MNNLNFNPKTNKWTSHIIISNNNKDDTTTTTICFDCGKSGFDLTSLQQAMFCNDPTNTSFQLCKYCANIDLKGEEISQVKGRLLQPKPECVLVATDTWSLTQKHAPGEHNFPLFFLMNRLFVCRFKSTNTLCIINPVRVDKTGMEPFGAIERLAQRTGCKIEYVLCTESSHTMYIAQYCQHFPQAKVLVVRGRITRTFPSLLLHKNLIPVYNGHPMLNELEELGLKFIVIEGAMERKMDLVKKERKDLRRGTFEGSFLLFKPGKVFINGAHVMILSGKLSHGAHGPVNNFLVWLTASSSNKYKQDKLVDFHYAYGLGTLFSEPIYDLNKIREAFQTVINDKDWIWYLDPHSSVNSIFPRSLLDSKLDRALDIYSESNKKFLDLKELEIPFGE
jgi:hypothetical protein